MNLDRTPEPDWLFGSPFARSLILVVSVTLYLMLKGRVGQGAREPQEIREAPPD